MPELDGNETRLRTLALHAMRIQLAIHTTKTCGPEDTETLSAAIETLPTSPQQAAWIVEQTLKS